MAVRKGSWNPLPPANVQIAPVADTLRRDRSGHRSTFGRFVYRNSVVGGPTVPVFGRSFCGSVFLSVDVLVYGPHTFGCTIIDIARNVRSSPLFAAVLADFTPKRQAFHCGRAEHVGGVFWRDRDPPVADEIKRHRHVITRNDRLSLRCPPEQWGGPRVIKLCVYTFYVRT